MARRVAYHQAMSRDNELLQVVTVYESGVTRQQIEKESRYTKRHALLAKRGKKYKYVENTR
ncbi:hypothetical protein [Metabacillus fastidiosus]|uniref:Uncharacterized protein n=1 Tax=Metabacillus fastidiosus TaxID=1458 RepID=A0ABU6NRU7_9BACI|nr:hypothetical protein [Metabacillus fastidiosus]